MSVLIAPAMVAAAAVRHHARRAGAAVEDLAAVAARATDLDLISSTAVRLACVAFAIAAVVLATYAWYIRRRPAAALHTESAVAGAALSPPPTPRRDIPERAATSAAPTISSSSSCSPSPSSDSDTYDSSESVSSEHEATSSPSSHVDRRRHRRRRSNAEKPLKFSSDDSWSTSDRI